MGQRVERMNIGLAPWTELKDVQNKLSSGDIVLLSARSIHGRTIRSTNHSAWSHVGVVVKSNLLHELYILEVVVQRDSLYHACFDDVYCPNDKTIMNLNTNSNNNNINNNNNNNNSNGVGYGSRSVIIGTQLQPLRSVIYSGMYDLIAVRRLKWKESLSRIGIDQILREQFPSNMPPEYDIISSGTILDDYLTSRLLNFTNQRMKLQIHPQKFRETLAPLFADNFILSASMDDIKCIASAECVALLFFKLGIFRSGTNLNDIVTKFVPSHFASSSPYYLPLNTAIVDNISGERYLYSDFQLWRQDILVSTDELPKRPDYLPTIKISSLQAYNTDPDYLRSLGLRSGDLIFFREEGVMGEAALKLQGGTYTRISMVVCLPNINKIFLLDAPTWYVNRQEVRTRKETKVLEQRLVTLDSILMGGAFSRVAIRRLLKKEDATFNTSNRIYAYLKVKPKENNIAWKRINSLFDIIEKDYGPLIRFDITSILSGYFVAMAYSQLGILSSEEQSKQWVLKSPVVWESQVLGPGFSLSNEEVLAGRPIASNVIGANVFEP
jgi:hypothetical protein